MPERKFNYPDPDSLDFTSFKSLGLRVDLISVIVVDPEYIHVNHGIIQNGYMDRKAYEETTKTGEVCFWSRGRERLWKKGETSGNHYTVIRDIIADCDGDSIIIPVQILGAGRGCHHGSRSCFDPKR